MTETQTESLPNPTTPATAATPTAADWDAQSEALKARFPKLPPSIVFAFHALQADPEMALGDIKAQASLHGIRVTAASVSAAERLLARNADDDGGGVASGAAPRPAAAGPRRPRRPRAADASLDVESLIRTTVGKIQGQGAVEAERLRESIRKAIAILSTAVQP